VACFNWFVSWRCDKHRTALKTSTLGAINSVNQQLYSQGVRTDMQALLYWLQQSQELETHNFNCRPSGTIHKYSLSAVLGSKVIPVFHSTIPFLYVHTHTHTHTHCRVSYLWRLPYSGKFSHGAYFHAKTKTVTISTSELNTALYHHFKTMEPTIVDLW